MVAELINISNIKQNVDDVLKVLVRIYGELRRDYELVLEDTIIYTSLSERKFLPKLYGIFKDGRLEEYLDSSRLLTQEEARQPIFYKEIARQLYHIHQLQMPVKKRPDSLALIMMKMLDEIMDKLRIYESSDSSKVIITELKQSYRNRAVEMLHFVRDNDLYKKTLKFIKVVFEDLKDQLCIVFSHNDLHAGNMLCVPDNTSQLPGKIRLQIIDYEWSSYNIRGLDLARFLNEWTIRYDIEEWPCYSYDRSKLPTDEDKMTFLRAYFSESATPNILDDTHELYKIKREMLLGLAFDMLLSAIWCFDQCLFTDVKFGFLEHGILRYEIFLTNIEELEQFYGLTFE